MKFEGKYLYNEIRFKDCSFLIKNRKIHNLEVVQIPVELDFRKPENNSEFQFEKFQSENPLTPKGYNYYIEYYDENKKTHKISIKLNFFQVYKLKWILKKSLFHTSKWSVIFNFIFGVVSIYFLFLNYNLSKKESNLANRNKSLIKKTDSLTMIIFLQKENIKSLDIQLSSHKDSVVHASANLQLVPLATDK